MSGGQANCMAQAGQEVETFAHAGNDSHGGGQECGNEARGKWTHGRFPSGLSRSGGC